MSFLPADSQHKNFECVKNVVNSQSYVAEFALHSYPVTENDILTKGQDAWDSALNTIICRQVQSRMGIYT